MENKLNLEFLKKMQSAVEPSIKPGETALETIQRMEKEKMQQMMSSKVPPQQPQPQTPPVQEVVFYEGFKFNRDFFTCMTLCIMKLNDPEINKIFEAFGFEMKDLNGKAVVLKRKKVVKK